MAEITIPIERYDQLVKAEQDANVLKGIIAAKVKHYSGLDIADLRVLHEAYNGGDEE